MFFLRPNLFSASLLILTSFIRISKRHIAMALFHIASTSGPLASPLDAKAATNDAMAPIPATAAAPATNVLAAKIPAIEVLATNAPAVVNL
jgi:hypothetical protein